MFDLNFNLGLGAWGLIIIASLAVGILLQFIGDVEFGYEWILTAIGFGVGAFVASEFFVDLRAFAPVWDNLAIVPALVGGLIVGLVVAVITRYATGGSFLRTPTAA